MTRHSYACVCSADCRARHASYQRQRRYDQYLGRPRLVDALGTHRRLQALYAAGWPWSELTERYGSTHSVSVLLGRPVVMADTAAAIAALYDQLDGQLPPKHRKMAAQLRRAEARGWQPPEAWLDDQLDDPAAQPYTGVEPLEDAWEAMLAGDLLAGRSMPPEDRVELIDRWQAAGRSLAELERANWQPHRDRKLYGGRRAA